MLGYGSTAFLISIGPMISNHGDDNRLGAALHELARQADGKSVEIQPGRVNILFVVSQNQLILRSDEAGPEVIVFYGKA
jgi:hypothetical protein